MPVTTNEIAKKIQTNINAPKVPRNNQFSSQILEKLPRNSIVKLPYLMNASPYVRKMAKVALIAMPEKSPAKVLSYISIALLRIIFA